MLSTHAANARVPRKDQISAFTNINDISATWLNQRPSVLTECKIQKPRIKSRLRQPYMKSKWIVMPVLGLAGCHVHWKLQVRFHSNLDGSSLAHAIQVPMGPLLEKFTGKKSLLGNLHGNENHEWTAKLEVLHLFRWFTHTHTHTGYCSGATFAW